MKKRLKRVMSMLLAAMIAATSAAYAPPAAGSQGFMPYVALEASEDMATPSEAVKATPSDAVPDEKISTPSQAEKTFVQVDPEEEEIPEYYNRISKAGKKFWKFEDRDGGAQYRDYGYIQGEAEFPLWYCLTAEGDLDVGDTSPYPSGVDLNDEYRTLAPYLYKSVEPTEESWEELEGLISTEGGLDTQNKEELRGFQNWDQTEYSINHLTAKEPAEELEEPAEEIKDLGYFFYGSISNADFGTCWWYADENGSVTSIVRIKRFMALAAGVTKFVRLWHDIPGWFKSSTQSYEYQITASSYKLPSLFDYVSSHVGTPDNTEKIIPFASTHVGWSTSRTGTTGLVSQDGTGNYYSLQDDPAKVETYLSGGTLYPKNYDYDLSDTTLIYNFYGVWCPENADMYIFFKEPYKGEPSYTPYATSMIIVRRDASFSLSKVSTPSKTGFTFTGWLFPSGDIVDAQSSAPIYCGHSGKVNYVYPKFSANENRVRFFDADGNLLIEQTVISGNAAAPPEAPNRTGYVFTGWDKSYTNVLSDLDITAQYKSTATLNIIGNGGTVYGEEQYSTELVLNTSLSTTLYTIQSNLIRDGYRFVSWYYFDENGVQKSGYPSKITSDITLYVSWEIMSYGNKFYYMLNYAPYYNVAATYMDYVKLPETDPPKIDGYIFEGWYTAQNGGEKLEESTVIQGSSAKSYYAHYKEDIVTITFDFNIPGETHIKTMSVPRKGYISSLDVGTVTRPFYFNGNWVDSSGKAYLYVSDIVGDSITLYRAWVGWDTYVRFYNNTGAQYESQAYVYTVKYGQPIKSYNPELPTGVNGSKVFIGWYTEKTGGNKITSETIVENGDTFNTITKMSGVSYGEVLVYAHYANAVNTVTFKNWDGTVIDTQEVAYGEDAVPPEVPVRPGYNFTGWDKDTASIQEPAIITAQYIRNTYTLTLDGNGGALNGDAIRIQEFSYGDSIDQALADGSAAASQKYFTFVGWYTDPTGGSKYTGITMPETDMTVYAHWIRSSSEVIYKDYDGTILKQQEVALGADATPPQVPERSGYTFTGWDKPSTNIQEDMVITAQYIKNSYKLTLNGNGGKISGSLSTDHILAYGEPLDQLLADRAAEASRQYYTFVGWYTDPNGGSKYTGSGNTMPASDVTVYASWIRSSSEVIYKDWNGTIIDKQEIAIGMDATPPADPTRSGYTFTGWDKPSTNIQAHTTITAQYMANGFILTLNGNGGTLAGDATKDQVLTYGEPIDQVLADGADEVSRKYYTFAGWYTDPTGGSIYTVSGNTMPASNITVYAHWMRSTNEVIYRDWNGNVLKTQEVAIGADAMPPADPVRPGYTFTGWDKPSTNIRDHTTITAQYMANRFILTLNGNRGMLAGDAVKNQVLTYRESIDQALADGVAEAYRKYYTFTGWYTAPTGGSKYAESGNTMPATDVMVYAHWMRSSSEVIYKDWDGKELKTQEIAIGADATPPADPVRPGYTFTGWDKPSTNIQDHTTITALYTTREYKQPTEENNDVAPVPVPPAIDTTVKPTVPDTGGTFTVNPENPYDVTYTKPDGTPAKDEWVGDGKDWYHVDEGGKLNYDWYLEGEKTWYKLNKETGNRFGAALIGWNNEPMDDKRYFFDLAATKMLTGWQNVDGKWYYFTKYNEAQTYYGSNRTGWKYDPTKPGKPYGSMYQSEDTPDGYKVDENGAWINQAER